MTDYANELKQAHRLADIADKIALQFYRSADLQIKTKPDTTPVTQADTEIEQVLSDIVLNEFGDAYLGEEGIRQTAKSGRTWVVDPIDGTKNFLRTMPFWAELIALCEGNVPVVAVVSAPALGRRWWAAKGDGSRTRDVDGTERALRVSQVAKLEDAFLLHSSIFKWDQTPVGSAAVLKLINSVWRERSPGDFLNYMLVAEGAADGCFEDGPKRWDLDAPSLIVTEAGGTFWSSANSETPAEDKRSAIASNGLIQQAVRDALNL